MNSFEVKKVKDAKSSETQDDGASFYIVAIPLRSSLEYKGYKCLFYMLRKLKGYCLFTEVHIEGCIKSKIKKNLHKQRGCIHSSL